MKHCYCLPPCGGSWQESNVASNCSARNHKTKRHKFGRQYDLQTFLPSFIPFQLLCVHLQKHINIPSTSMRWWSLFKNGLSNNLENFASEGDILFLLHQVCINVTELRCNIHLYLECKTIMTSTKFPSDKKVKVSFTPKNCTVIEETVYHKKPKPKCITEERENCVEAWKTLANGTQVLQQISNKEPHNFLGLNFYRLTWSLVQNMKSIHWFAKHLKMTDHLRPF